MRSGLRSLVSDSAVYGLADIIARFITIFLVPIYTRLFTPEDYGVLSLVNSSLTVVAILVVLGLDNSANRWYWDTDDEIDRHRTIASWTWCQLVAATVMGTAMFASADWLALTIVEQERAALYFRLAALGLPLTAIGKIATTRLRMQRRPWVTTFYALGTTIVTVVSTVVLVIILRWGLTGVYVGQLMGYGIATIAGLFLLKSWISPKCFSAARLREMLRFAIPIIPASLAYWVVGFADRYFVQAYASTAEVGLYSVGSAVAAVVAFATGAFQMAWPPFAFSIHKEPHAKQTYANAFLAYLWLTVAISAGASLFAPEAIRLLATSEYLGATSVVGLLALSYVMIGLVYIANTGPGIVKRSGPTGLAMTVAAILNVVLNFLLVPRYGKFGSAIATFISQAVTPAYIFYRSQQMYPIPYRFKSGLAIVSVGLVVMAAGSRLEFGSLWLAIPTKLALMSVFVPLLFVLRLVTPSEIRRYLGSRATFWFAAKPEEPRS
jgi:O-antigen/teichoic acid export membrane protein